MTLHLWMKPPYRLPLSESPVRFAVGSPEGVSSNSWRLWTSRGGDVYAICRDNFNDAKLSLHASGVWRFAHTRTAVEKDPSLLDGRDDRVWEKWQKPDAAGTDAVCAFQFVFPTSELAVGPEGRAKWPKTIVFVEPLEDMAQMTVLSLFIAPFLDVIRVKDRDFVPVAHLRLPHGGSAQLLAHYEPVAGADRMVQSALERVRGRLGDGYEKMPEQAYVYLFGRRSSGARFVVGSRAFREREAQGLA